MTVDAATACATQDAERSLEIDLLLILGAFAAIFGALLVPIGAGRLPYSPDSAYGLFLVLIAFQTLAIGKSPFGDVRRSWALVGVGLIAAALGIVACFIPGLVAEAARIGVGALLSAGGLSLLMQLAFDATKARRWLTGPPVLKSLALTCATVYGLGVVVGVITLLPGRVAVGASALAAIAFGASLFALAGLLHKVQRRYPAPPATPGAASRFVLLRDARLPPSEAILILLGLSLALLGFFLFPVDLGLLPFSPDGQLGLLLTLMAIQAMALGETPLGRLTRPAWMLAIGLLFAAAGIVSAIVPGLLTDAMRLLLAVLNVGGGARGLSSTFRSTREPRSADPPAPFRPILRALGSTQTILNALSLMFGVSMLIPGLIPGFLIAVILIGNGAMLIRLAKIIHQLAALDPKGAR